MNTTAGLIDRLTTALKELALWAHGVSLASTDRFRALRYKDSAVGDTNMLHYSGAGGRDSFQVTVDWSAACTVRDVGSFRFETTSRERIASRDSFVRFMPSPCEPRDKEAGDNLEAGNEDVVGGSRA